MGPLQLRIMNFIWEHGMSTVHDVHGALNEDTGSPQLAYTTILTVMRNLVRRQLLSQMPAPHGRSHVFQPTVTADNYRSQLMSDICDAFFDGNTSTMIEAINQ